MDLGVGSFVFALGLICALPLLQSWRRRPFFSTLLTSIKRSAGVLALGIVRVLMVKGVEYPVSFLSSSFVNFQTRKKLSPLTKIYNLVGARNRVWSTLELLLHSCTRTNSRSSIRMAFYQT